MKNGVSHISFHAGVEDVPFASLVPIPVVLTKSVNLQPNAPVAPSPPSSAPILAPPIPLRPVTLAPPAKAPVTPSPSKAPLYIAIGVAAVVLYFVWR